MTLLISLLILTATLLILLASLGIVRMPDFYTRMHASAKAASLAIALFLLAAALHFGDLAVTTRVIATTIFIFITAPVAAHILGRAAYSNDIPRWKGTWKDEIQEHQKKAKNAPTSRQR